MECETAQLALQNFAASVLHELRTPLAALASEIEIALRRSRTAAAYQEALTRVSVQAAELIELTSDLALFANPDAYRSAMAAGASLQSLLGDLSHRFDHAIVTIESGPMDIRLAGDEALLSRALRLMLDHAVRHRVSASPVHLRAHAGAAFEGGDNLELVLEASAPGFARENWRYLLHDDLDRQDPGRSGWMRLHTAALIIRMAGGSLALDGEDDAVRIRILLRTDHK